MAAIVAGGSFGILQSSAALLGAQGQIGSAAQGRAGERVYLNAATGNLVIQGRDEIVIGRGPDGAFLRTYNSQGLLNDDNGDNWRLNFHRRVAALTGTLNTAGSTIKRTDADGAEALYTYDVARGKYVTTEGDGAYDTLSYNAGTWTWTDGASGVAETYSDANSGRLASVVDESGNALAFGYNGAGLLTSVQTAGGDTTYLDYTGTNLTQIRTVASGGATLIRTTYGYDGSNRLTQVTTDLTPDNTTDSKTYVTTYTYDGTSRRVATMAQTDGTSVAFTYQQVGADYRVSQISQTVAGVQRVTSVSYDTTNRTTTVTDPLGRATVLAYDTANRLTGITMPAASGAPAQQVGYAYDASGNVSAVTDARGNAVVYGYDANGNRTYERDAAGNVVERSYGAKNELLTEIAYVTPDPDGAGSGQPSGALTTRYVYDANTRLRFVVSAAGRVTEHRYNGYGQRVSTIEYTSGTYTAAGTPTEAQMVAWLPADRSASIRSDMSYDFRGQVSAVATYTAVDSAGNGIASGQSVTQFVYDQAGNLLQSVDGRGTATAQAGDFQTSYAYDGLGRVIATTDALGQLTLTDYQDATRKTVVTLANGLLRTSTYTAAGELISVLEGTGSTTLAETKYFYDANGRLRRTEDATGLKTHVLYDGAGRKIAAIDGDGSLTEYRYDANDNVVRTIQYATPVSSTALATLADAQGVPQNVSLASIRPASSSADRSAWNVFDAANRLIRTVEPGGLVTQYAYDGAGRLTGTLRFATLVSERALVLPGTSGTYAGTPDSAATSITGDLDLRVRAAPDDWTPALAFEFLDKMQSDFVEHSYLLRLNTDGKLSLYWTQDGTTLRSATSTAAVGAQDGVAKWVRATLDVDNGAGGRDIKFYISDDGVSWTQLGTTVTQSGVTSVYDGTASVQIGGERSGVAGIFAGKIYAAEIRNGIDGAVAARFNPLDAALHVSATPASFTASTGEVWTLNGGATMATTSSADRTTRNFHDAQDKLLATLDGGGYLVEYKYDSAGQLVETVAYATATNPSLRVSGTLDQLRPSSAGGDVHAYVLYNARGQVAGAIDGEGYLTETVYDAAGNKTQLIRYATKVTYTAGATLGSLRPASTAQDQVHTYVYNALNRVTSETNSLGVVTQYTYDQVGNLVTTVQAQGTGDVRSLNAQYDKQGRLTAELSGVGSALLTGSQTQTEIDAIWNQYAVKHTYDAAGRRKSTTDALGNRTLFYYDADGRLTYTIGANSEVRRSAYNALGQLSQSTAYGTRLSGTALATLNGGLVDAALNTAVSAITSATLDSATSYVYYRSGVLAQTIDALGNVTTHTYNAFNELTLTEQPSGVAVQRAYDANGRVTSSIVDPGGLNLETRFAYDALGRTLTLTEGAGSANPRVTQYQYDKLGRVTSETIDPGAGKLNLVTGYVYDKNGNVIRKTNAAGNVTRYYYDANDRLIYTLDAANGLTKVVYDALGRAAQTIRYANALIGLPSEPTRASVEAAIQPSAGRDALKTYIYDKDGHEIFCVDGLSGVTKKIYDKNGRVVEQIVYATKLPAGTALNATAIAAAQATNAADRSTRLVYDEAGRAIYSIDASGAVTQTWYDAKGNVARTVAYANAAWPVTADPAKDRSEWRFYDNANRLVYTVDALGFAKETRYDTASRISATVQYAAAITLDSTPTTAEVSTALAALPANTPNQTNTFVYDAADRLASSTDAAGFSESFTYDAVGNKLTFTNKKGSVWTYQYDANHRLVKEVSPVVPVTSVNPTTLVATTTNVAIETRIAYDALGNVTSRTEAFGLPEGRVTTYEYDALGRQVRTNFPQLGVYNAAGDDLTTNGINGTVNRVEATQTPYVVVTYDALGNAVVNRDAAGNYSYKVYDVLGRVRYEIDAERYVIERKYSVHGDEIEMTRYATALSFTGHPDATAPFTEAEVAAALTTSAQDRKLINTCDKLGRITQVDEPSAYNYDPTVTATANQTFTAGRITKNTYDVFGHSVKQSFPAQWDPKLGIHVT